MGDVLIIGAGPAGLSAARLLVKKRALLAGRRILLVDCKRSHHILPLLADVVSKRVSQDNAVFGLDDYLGRLGVNFECGEVVGLDLESRGVELKGAHTLSYEFLIVSCGLHAEFASCPDAARWGLKLDTADDALILANAVITYPRKRIVVVTAGGWEGVETAAGLAVLLRQKKEDSYEISLVAKDEDVLSLSWPRWMRDYCRINLCGLRVGLHTRACIKSIDDCVLRLTNGMEVEDYLLVWCGDVAPAPFVRGAGLKKDGSARIVVDGTLAFGENCFAAGDAVSSDTQGGVLRRGVPSAVGEGEAAAGNILRIISGRRELIRYRPRDPGLLVAMANRKSCGRILGARCQGFLGWGIFHLFCIAQMPHFRQKIDIFKDVFLRR